MRQFKRVIFASGNGVSRAPMAAALLKEQLKEEGFSDIEVISRGLIVQFPEPLNQKVEAVMASNGLTWDGFAAEELSDEDITDDTVVFVMEEKRRQQVIEKYDRAHETNVFLLSAYVGDELEIMNPYGENLQIYGMCFEVIRETVKKLVPLLTDRNLTTIWGI